MKAPRWRICVSDGLDPEGLTLLRAEAETLQDPDLTSLGEVDGMIVRSRTRVTADVLRRGRPRLKVVGRAGVGVDNIDLHAARAQGVIVVNAPLALTTAVAEHALALMLALAREIPRADAQMKQGQWAKKELVGIELGGKTLGIIGVGRIGAALTRRARALEMRVLGHDPLIPEAAIRQAGAEPVALEVLLSRSDFISLHVPLTEDTRGMMGTEMLAKCKPGARLISTARGGVIDEEALLAALDEGHIAGAALDVFASEPPGRSALVLHPKVVCTPHIAAQTKEAQVRAARDIAEEVLAALHGRPLRWRVA